VSLMSLNDFLLLPFSGSSEVVLCFCFDYLLSAILVMDRH